MSSLTEIVTKLPFQAMDQSHAMTGLIPATEELVNLCPNHFFEENVWSKLAKSALYNRKSFEDTVIEICDFMNTKGTLDLKSLALVEYNLEAWRKTELVDEGKKRAVIAWMLCALYGRL